MSFDHVMATACVQTITLLYIYFCVWKLDLRLNNINLHQFLSFIICIDLNHNCHDYWTSESLLNLWECTQGSDITNKWVVYFVIVDIFPFHFTQFLSSFLKFSFSNFLLFHPYKIFAIYLPRNSPLLKFFSSAISSFSCLLTSVLIFPLNSATHSFAFSKSSSLSQLSCFAVNLFHCTKYFTTFLTFCLFNILSTSHSLTPSISIGFTSSFFCLPTWFLYHTIWLTFTTGWILIEMDRCNLTTLVNITPSMIYRPTY